MRYLVARPIEATQFEWDKAVFSIEVEGATEPENEDIRKLRITLAFVPLQLLIRGIRRSSIYLGSTGAVVHLTLNDGVLRDYSKGSRIRVKYHNSKERDQEVRFSPEIEIERDDDDSKVKASFVEFKMANNLTTDADFEGVEWPIKATRVGPQRLRWSVASHRGAKIVRDYREGNVFLEATCTRPHRKPSTARIEALPSDLQFYSNEGKRLGLIGSLAARIRMWSDRKSLPSTSPVKLQVELP